MAVAGLQITRQTIDAGIGAGLGMHVATGRLTPAHAMLQRTVYARHGQSLIKLAEDVGV